MVYHRNNQSYRDQIHADLHALLCDEAEKRRQRGVDFAKFERLAMWRKVNEVRAELGKDPLPLRSVEEVEQYALGHFDYGLKFALYCSELVLDRP
jgi:hypothetical protein